MKKYLALILCALLSHVCYSQSIINAFAKVTGISGTTLDVSNENESYDSFQPGEQVIIMQMQDDVIGGNTSNDASFGDLGSIGSVGLYEAATIASVDRSAGLVSITLETNPTNTYSIGANSSVQLVTFPHSTDFTTTADLTTVAWDGNVGGVLAIDVDNTFTLAHNIDVSGMGFRGGWQHPSGLGGGCVFDTYTTSSDQYGYKGEGIYKSTDANHTYARGKILTGGGGGNPHNAGGGGGGNFTAGGDGGEGYGCGGTSAGGLGGIDLSAHISGNRIFMGGGGGGGQQNNAVGTNGGNGGGIIIIRAGEILVEPACGGLTISSNGQESADAGNDGVGGSGAGGTIIFEVGTWTLDCGLTIQTNGGNGGDVLGSTATHGGGGGGGKGVILFSGNAPATNFTTENNQGIGGANDSDGNGGTGASGESNPTNPAADASGVVEQESGPLPVDLLYWQSVLEEDRVILIWATSTELDNEYFTIEKSLDGKHWEVLTMIQGAGNSNQEIQYDFVDDQPGLVNYYRLSQTDFDGTTEVFEVLKVNNQLSATNVVLYPNPGIDVLKLNLKQQEYSLLLVDMSGRTYLPTSYWKGNELMVDTRLVPRGVYFLELKLDSGTQRFRVILKE